MHKIALRKNAEKLPEKCSNDAEAYPPNNRGSVFAEQFQTRREKAGEKPTHTLMYRH